MAHLHEKIDFTASVFIVRGEETLMLLHLKIGKWLQPGGHIELYEDLVQAAKREALEETGFEVELVGNPQLPELADDPTDLPVPKHVNRHPFEAKPGHEHVDFVYYARIIGGTQKAEPKVELRWHTEETLADATLVMPRAVRAYGRAALRELGTKTSAPSA